MTTMTTKYVSHRITWRKIQGKKRLFYNVEWISSLVGRTGNESAGSSVLTRDFKDPSQQYF